MILDENLKLYESTGQTGSDESFPPVAGELCFLKKLRIRVTNPIDWISTIDHPVVQSETMLLALDKHKQLIVRHLFIIVWFTLFDQKRSLILDCFVVKELIGEKEEEIFKDWTEKVPEIVAKGLSNTLFIKNEEGKLAANLDEELAMVLKETRYMVMILEKNELPVEALDVFARATFFYDNNVKLNNISKWLVDINPSQ